MPKAPQRPAGSLITKRGPSVSPSLREETVSGSKKVGKLLIILIFITITNIKMIRDLDIRALRSFLAVAEHGNVTAAAQQRTLTQSAVSRQIKKLEGYLGQQLLQRIGSGVSLTKAGKVLLPLARKSICANDEILIAMGQDNIGATIRLGVAHDLVSMLLPKPLSMFHQCYPLADVVLVSASSPTLNAMLASGDVDLAITTDKSPVPDAHLILASNLVWVGANDGSAHELGPLPIAVRTQDCPFRQAMATKLLDTQRAWKPMTQPSSLEAMTATVKADLAIFALLEDTIPPDLSRVSTIALPELPEFLIHLWHPNRTLSAVETSLCENISTTLAKG